MTTKKLLNSFFTVSIFIFVFSCGKRTSQSQEQAEVPIEEEMIETEELSIDEMEANAIYCWVHEINPKLEPFVHDKVELFPLDKYQIECKEHLLIQPMTINGNSYLTAYYNQFFNETKHQINLENHEESYVMGLEDEFEQSNETIYKFVSIKYLKANSKGLYVDDYSHPEKSKFQFTITHNLVNGSINVNVPGKSISFTKNLKMSSDKHFDGEEPPSNGGLRLKVVPTGKSSTTSAITSITVGEKAASLWIFDANTGKNISRGKGTSYICTPAIASVSEWGTINTTAPGTLTITAVNTDEVGYVREGSVTIQVEI